MPFVSPMPSRTLGTWSGATTGASPGPRMACLRTGVAPPVVAAGPAAKPGVGVADTGCSPVFHVDAMANTPNQDDEGTGTGTGVVTRTRPQTRKPSLYRVLMLNDDYTPMEFVVHVLQRFFRMSLEEATRVMLHVHQKGVGVCGIFTYEVAETKVTQVMDFAKQHQHPLQCTLEKA